MSSSNKSPEQPLVEAGGVRDPADLERPTPVGDPYAALDDLMVVVEALCPTWPERPLLTRTQRMLL